MNNFDDLCFDLLPLLCNVIQQSWYVNIPVVLSNKESTVCNNATNLKKEIQFQFFDLVQECSLSIWYYSHYQLIVSAVKNCLLLSLLLNFLRSIIWYLQWFLQGNQKREYNGWKNTIRKKTKIGTFLIISSLSNLNLTL